MAAALTPELLQLIFSFLDDDDDRIAALGVCRTWHAAMAANPGVWPTVELWAHIPAALQADLGNVAEMGPAGLLWLDSCNCLSRNTLGRVAAVPPRTERVRLRGFEETPHTLFGHLALLPAGLTRLELSCRCGGPLPAALQRFTALRALVVSGNGAEVEWGCRGGAAALARLSTLHLDCRLPEYELHGYGDDPLVEILPMGQSTQLPNELLQPLLAAALPRLRSAHLACSFGADVPRLCRHLAQQGALRELKLHLVGVYDDPFDLQEEGQDVPPGQRTTGRIAGLLIELSQAHSDLALGITADTYSQDDEEEQNWDDEEVVEARGAARLPPLAGISTLRSLDVRHMPLPSDWRQLSGLTALEIGSSEKVNWRPSLSALAQLQRLGLGGVPLPSGRLPAALCHLPALRMLRLSGKGSLHFPAAASSLRCLEDLFIDGYSVEAVPEPIRQLTTLRSLVIDSTKIQGLAPGSYLAGLTELHLSRLDCIAGLPPSLAAATSLRSAIVGRLQRAPRLPADQQLLAALPRLRLVRDLDERGYMQVY